jgi:ferrous iron transport protein A
MPRLAPITENDYQISMNMPVRGGAQASSPTFLGALALGERAVVESLAIERPVARRLMELGLLPGTVVELVRRAPLGDPLEISLRGYRLSLRKSEAARVVVRPEPE